MGKGRRAPMDWCLMTGLALHGQACQYGAVGVRVCWVLVLGRGCAVSFNAGSRWSACLPVTI